MSASDSAAAAPKRIEFEDPHAGIGNLQEAEVTRVRVLQGGWRWALVVATAATILLCINQQFSLRFFIDYTQLNTEYFYLLIALMLISAVGGLMGGRIWRYELKQAPGTESGTLVRETWDVSQDKQKWMITSGSMPAQTEEGMRATLDRIAELLER